MDVRIYSDKIIFDDKTAEGYIYINKGVIVGVEAEKHDAEFCYDYKGFYVSAGFVDTHTHGGGGHPFLEGSLEDVVLASEFHLKHGTTTIVPTLSAAPFSVMEKSAENIIKAKRSDARGNILGVHMEGPYLSCEQCGAQSPDFITLPQKSDYKRLIEKYPHEIKRWTFAPETDPNGEFCKFLTENGVLASAGHTNAEYKDMKTAIDNGLCAVTHLYSCTSTVTRDHGFRKLGVIETAFLRDEIYCEIIADGKHLPPELIKMIIKIKGSDKVFLTTDSLDLAGTDKKEGIIAGTEYIIEDGVCKLKDMSAFAGSIATADVLVRVLTKDCGFDIPHAVKMLTKVPSELMGLKKGSIKKDYDADIVVFNENIEIKDVFVGGKKCEF